MKTKFLSLFLCFLLISPISICAAPSAAQITAVSPADGYELTVPSPLHLSAATENAALVQFLIDSSLVAEFSENTALCEFDIDNILAGKRIFEVIAYDSKGNTVIRRNVINVTYPIGTALSTKLGANGQDFNDMAEITDANGRAAVGSEYFQAFTDKYGWIPGQWGPNQYMTREVGRSGVAGDYALGLIAYHASGSETGADMCITTDSPITDGVVECSFDWKAVFQSSTKAFYADIITIPGATRRFIPPATSRPISETSVSAVPGQWINMNYVIDFDNRKTTLTVTNLATGASDTIEYTIAADAKFETLRFMPQWGSADSYNNKNYLSKFTLDNVIIRRPGTVSVTDTGYTKNLSDTLSESLIPYDAEKIYMALSETGITATPADLSMKIDGKDSTVDSSDVSYSSGKIYVALPSGLKGGERIELCYKDKAKAVFEVDSPVTDTVVFSCAGSALGSNTAASVQIGDVISASWNADNNSGDEVTLNLILMARKNEQLVAIAVKEVTLAVGPNRDIDISLGAMTANYTDLELDIIAIDSFDGVIKSFK